MDNHQSNDDKLRLPNAIVSRIFSYLDPHSLARTAAVSHQFQELAYSEILWKIFVNSYLPNPIESCKPAPSFRLLFIAFHPYWFIPKFRFWLSDEQPHGQLIIAHFNTARLCIEAWAVAANREDGEHRAWSVNPNIMIRESDVRVYVDENHLVFRFGVQDEEWTKNEENQGICHTRAAMMYEDSPTPIGPKMQLSLGNTRSETPTIGDSGMWPTPDMPASTLAQKSSAGNFTSIPASHEPSSSPTACHPTFRLSNRPNSRPGHGSTDTRPFSIGSEHDVFGKTVTYGTMSPNIYAPSVEKPWQGIWCGDYLANGVEFLLMLQPDLINKTTLTESVHTSQHSYPGRSGSNRDENAVPKYHKRSSLMAIKLTGDLYVPRWQYGFVVPNLFENGLIRIADEEEFRGAPVVRSALHVAAKGFQHNQYSSSQLFLLSHDRLAQYWEGTEFISYYRRVDITRLKIA